MGWEAVARDQVGGRGAGCEDGGLVDFCGAVEGEGAVSGLGVELLDVARELDVAFRFLVVSASAASLRSFSIFSFVRLKASMAASCSPLRMMASYSSFVMPMRGRTAGRPSFGPKMSREGG